MKSRYQRLLLGLVCVALGDPLHAHSHAFDGITDRAMLLSLIGQARTSIKSLQVSCKMDRLYTGYSGQAPTQTWNLGWNDGGFRVETLTSAADSGAPIDDAWVRIFDRARLASVTFDGHLGAQVSANPLSLGFGGLAPEYYAFIGYFPTKSLTGDTLLVNDVETMLADPRCQVLDAPELLRGLSCVVVELLGSAADGSTYVKCRGFYAPDLGFAQVRFELHYPDGKLQSSWDSFGFVPFGDGLTSAPTHGEIQLLFQSGELEGRVTLDVLIGQEGAPMVTSGQPLSLELLLPHGVVVTNIDSGSTQTIELPKSFATVK